MLNFSVLDNRIWFRHYQIVDAASEARDKDAKPQLVEIGPRFVMNIVRVFDGGFSGRTLYENPRFRSPNTLRREENEARGDRYKRRKTSEARKAAKDKVNEESVPKDPLDGIFK